MILEGKHEWAENWLKEGEERGIKLGEERGIKLGEKLGEERTKRENALRMLDKGFGIADVAECVNLSEAEVRRLAEETRQ